MPKFIVPYENLGDEKKSLLLVLHVELVYLLINLFCRTSFDEAQLQEYFPFEHVLVKLLEISSELFGISFEEVPSGEVSTWHPDVRFFQVTDANGEYLSSFYLDPYSR